MKGKVTLNLESSVRQALEKASERYGERIDEIVERAIRREIINMVGGTMPVDFWKIFAAE